VSAHGEAPHVRLANDIAAQFHHRDGSAAAAEIAAHIRSFWEPRMIEALRAAAADRTDGLDPLAVRAAELLP
jgi:formate dehydrogenase subunit delta